MLASLARPEQALLESPELEPSHVVMAAAQQAQFTQRMAREQTRAAAAQAAAQATPPVPPGADPQMQPQGEAKAAPVAPDMAASPDSKAADKERAAADNRLGVIRRMALNTEADARIGRSAATDEPMLERLVLFWSNHFCVSALKGNVRAIAGAYEREAIRPFVLGRFGDMVKAVVRHPAMLVYLDNNQSTGPNSRAGINRNRGLNENLGRELLELHTLGVDGGYSQDDVTNLARILTGWTIGNLNVPGSEPGKFHFAPNRHEPGAWSVLGKVYENDGEGTTERVLVDLARHPSTARHIARKLAAHFVSDQPPPALVSRLEKSFRDSQGDLGAVTRTLVSSPEAWTEPARKVVPPYEFLVSLMRGLELNPNDGEIMRLAAALGQPLWQPPSPKGWSDRNEEWMGPAAMRERLRVAERAARHLEHPVDPRALADDLLGGCASPETREAIARAEIRAQGLELLIMSPEFQRR